MVADSRICRVLSRFVCLKFCSVVRAFSGLAFHILGAAVVVVFEEFLPLRARLMGRLLGRMARARHIETCDS
jgi:hypothetical protein